MIPIYYFYIKDFNDDNKNLCDELKKNLEKFSKYNNIYRSLLYDYKLFCEK